MKRPCRCSHLEDAHIAGERCRHCHCEKFLDATTEHTAGLRELALPAMVEAKRVLTATGQVPPLLLFREADGRLSRYEVPESCAAIMDDGHAKDLFFGALRDIVRELKLQAVVIATDGWLGRSTVKAQALPHEEFLKATCERGFAAAVAEGLVERSAAIIVSVQTPERAMMVNQLYKRNDEQQEIQYLEVSLMEMPIDHLRGRQKMYGDLRPENLS